MGEACAGGEVAHLVSDPGCLYIESLGSIWGRLNGCHVLTRCGGCMSAQYTIGDGIEIVEAFVARHAGLVGASGVLAIGFGLRDDPAKPVIVVTAGSEYGYETARLIAPSSFHGFDVWIECDVFAPAGMRLDGLRRVVGMTPKHSWPCWPGAWLLSSGRNRAGTLGCYVRDASSSGRKTYAITCEHVILSRNPARQGTAVRSYVRTPRLRESALGVVSARPIAVGVSHLDIGVVDVAERLGINVIPRIGRVATAAIPLTQVRLGTAVAKYGAASKLTVGQITAVQVMDGNGSLVPAGFVAEVTPLWDGEENRYTSFCSSGDSGSLVTSRPVGGGAVIALGILARRSTLLDRGHMIGIHEFLTATGLDLC